LGAATAASSKEISDGLGKFAAVAKTVDLSYETAAAAVATVVDKTRQSADVVGTAFKTIFARMEGLSLGETLEDGTNLNKYSEALATVGVNIKKADGELKSMDTILNELGSKWQLLGEDSKIALAQTVGGMRQYNQFMALMENWEGPTGVLANVEKAKKATGELIK
jgi:TP901 family phage tail tape measure protein